MDDLKKPITPRKPPGRFLILLGLLVSPLPESLRRLVRATLVLVYAVLCYGVEWLRSRRLRPPRLRRYEPPAFPPRYIRMGGVSYPVNVDLLFTAKLEELTWLQTRIRETELSAPEECLTFVRRKLAIFAPTVPRQEIERLTPDQLFRALAGIKAWTDAAVATRQAALTRWKGGGR